MVLFADKVHRDLDALDLHLRQDFIPHGTDGGVSVIVNAHAIARARRASRRPGPAQHLQRRVVHRLRPADGWIGSARVGPFPRHFGCWLDDPGPVDAHRLFDVVVAGGSGSVGLAILLLRLCAYDDYVFHRAADALPNMVKDVDEKLRADLAHALREVWRRTFHYDPDDDLAFYLGRVFSAMGLHEDGYRMYQESLERAGPHRATAFNLAVSAEALGRRDEAMAWIDEALELDPDYELAHAWRAEHLTP